MKRKRCWGLHDWTRYVRATGEAVNVWGRSTTILINVRDCRRCGVQQAKRVMT